MSACSIITSKTWIKLWPIWGHPSPQPRSNSFVASSFPSPPPVPVSSLAMASYNHPLYFFCLAYCSEIIRPESDAFKFNILCFFFFKRRNTRSGHGGSRIKLQSGSLTCLAASATCQLQQRSSIALWIVSGAGTTENLFRMVSSLLDPIRVQRRGARPGSSGLIIAC